MKLNGQKTMTKASELKATVFIPTYNGERYLKQLLTAVFNQKTSFKYEVIVTDSSSTDGTIDIIRKFKKKHSNLRFDIIETSEFGHGKTRNRAAHMAKGEIIVFLSHDAIPASNMWLHEMVKPFEFSDKIAGVLGKQIPRPNCMPLLKNEIRAVFGSFGPDIATGLYYKDSFMGSDAIFNAVSFYSDVNSATRRSLLVGEIPYHDVPYAEDYMFGKDIINKGYIKAYAPRGAVVHSNDLELREYKHRIFDETLGIRRLGVDLSKPPIGFMLKQIIKGSLKDAVRTIRDTEYSTKRKFYWLVVNPLFHIEKWRGYRRATITDVSDEDMLGKYSLEKRRRK